MASGFKKFAKPAVQGGTQPAAVPVVETPAPVAPAAAPAAPAAVSAPTLEDLQKQLAAAQAALVQAQTPASAVNAAALAAQPATATIHAPIQATPAPAPEPVKTAEVFPAPGVVTNPTEAHANALALFSGTPGNALSAFIATSGEGAGGAAMKFPVVGIAGGNTGGAWNVDEWVAKAFGQETADSLPSARKPVDCVFLGYRLEVAAWPKGFEDREDGSRPSYNVAISAADSKLMQTATRACKNYQYTKKADKAAFDYDKPAKAGHVRPTVQVLVFLADIGLVVLASPLHYTSTERTLKNLARNTDPKTGALNPFPATIRPVSTEDKTPAQTWKTHHLEFSVNVTEAGKKVWDQFNDWRANILPSDPETTANVKEFLAAQDRPVTPDIEQSLVAAANI